MKRCLKKSMVKKNPPPINCRKSTEKLKKNLRQLFFQMSNWQSLQCDHKSYPNDLRFQLVFFAVDMMEKWSENHQESS